MQPRLLLNEGKVKKISQDTKSTLLKRAIFVGSIILRNFVCPEGEPDPDLTPFALISPARAQHLTHAQVRFRPFKIRSL
jgi:hypothetical protein